MSQSNEKPEGIISIDTELIAQCRVDPVIFAQVFCKFYPHNYQAKILRDHAQNIAIRMGRQMGKTAATAIKALWFAYTRPTAVSDNQDITTVIIAPSQRQSKIMYNQIRAYIHANPLLERSVVKSTLEKIELDNGSVIHNFPVGDSAEKVRGFSIDLLIVDEAAYIKERIYTALLPSLASTNGKLILIGTPAMRSGMFYHAFYPNNEKEIDIEFSTHHYPYSYATSVVKYGPDGLPLSNSDGTPFTQLSEKWLRYQESTMPPGAFAQEYEARFVDDSLGYFNRADILGNIEDYPIEFRSDNESVYSMGVDFAKYHDSYVAIVVKKQPDGMMRVVYMMEHKKREYSETVPKTIEIAKRFGCKYVFCDSTGVGEPNVEVIKNELKGYAKVEGVNLSSLQKQNDMYANVARLFGEGLLKVPISAKSLIRQLSMVMRSLTPTGRPKIEAAEGHHDDYPDALALACMISSYITSVGFVSGKVPKTLGGGLKTSHSYRTEIQSNVVARREVVLDRKGRPIGLRPLRSKRGR